VPPIVCKKCSSQLEISWKFCRQCGDLISNQAVTKPAENNHRKILEEGNPQKNSSNLAIMLVIAVLIFSVGGGFYFLKSSNSSTTNLNVSKKSESTDTNSPLPRKSATEQSSNSQNSSLSKNRASTKQNSTNQADVYTSALDVMADIMNTADCPNLESYSDRTRAACTNIDAGFTRTIDLDTTKGTGFTSVIQSGEIFYEARIQGVGIIMISTRDGDSWYSDQITAVENLFSGKISGVDKWRG
jgi:flagellar basal body-associated protein FliL